MRPPEQTTEEVLQGFDLTLGSLKVACEPTLPDHKLVFQPASNNYGDFWPSVFFFFITTDPDARQYAEGYVGGFFMEIEQRDCTVPPSDTNRKIRLDRLMMCDNFPHPTLFGPVIEKIQALMGNKGEFFNLLDFNE